MTAQPEPQASRRITRTNMLEAAERPYELAGADRRYRRNAGRLTNGRWAGWEPRRRAGVGM